MFVLVKEIKLLFVHVSASVEFRAPGAASINWMDLDNTACEACCFYYIHTKIPL